MPAVLVDYALTTVSDVKENLGLASSDHTKDNLITRKINQISDLIQNYCGRNFKLQAYVQYYDGSNIDELVLKQRPIVSDGTHSFSVESRNTSLNDGNFETLNTDLYFIDTTSGVLELNFNARGHWDRYRVTYSAGYATIPNDLAEAAATLAAYFVNHPAGATVGVVLQKEGQRELRYNPNNNTLNFKNIIQQLGIDETIDSYANLPVLTDN